MKFFSKNIAFNQNINLRNLNSLERVLNIKKKMEKYSLLFILHENTEKNHSSHLIT